MLNADDFDTSEDVSNEDLTDEEYEDLIKSVLLPNKLEILFVCLAGLQISNMIDYATLYERNCVV